MKNFNIKKMAGLFAFAIALLIMGCKEEVHKTEQVPAPEREVIVVPPPPPPPPVEKPTSISLDKNGVNVKTEKVDVRVGE